jgi:DNA-binding NarL/FixJ family response regulator
LKTAITTVAQGRAWFSDEFLRVKSVRHQDSNSFDKLLTERERDVLAMVGRPLTDAEISKRLEIAEETVEKHRFNILRKLGLESTTELVRYARDHGFTWSFGPDEDDALLP